ncbi:MAG: DNA polymerase III subunit delta [Pseudomonadales bacterium]
MQVEANSVAGALKGGLPPVVLVTGDETLLVEETCDTILARARADGFTEREVLFADAGFAWGSLLEDAQSLSLFATRKIIDLRLTLSRLDGNAAAEVIRRFGDSPNPDARVLIRTGDLRSDQRKAAWYRAVEACGLVVTVRPVDLESFDAWLLDRLKRAGLVIETDALALFASMMEGNLLAAVQEIERLKLAGLPSPLTSEALATQLEDSSHHSAFAFVDALMAGDAPRVARALENLRQEGESPLGPLAVLVSTLRRAEKGDWMPSKQQRLLPAFRRRVGPLAVILGECALLDQQGKGQLPGDMWQSLLSLSLWLCGKPLPLPAQIIAWRRLP